MMKNKILNFTGIIICAVILSGCATMKSWVGMNPEPAPVTGAEAAPKETFVKYSDTPQMGAVENRSYRRMNRAKMEEESDLGSQAGSLWMMDGQTSYLFAQNKVRNEGDILSIKMEGAAIKQVDTKVTVIRKLLKQLEDQQKQQALQLQLAQQAAEKARTPASTPTTVAAAAVPAPALAPAEKSKDDEKQDLSDIQNVTTKIIEKMPDGNYRLKGQQPFMIGKREFKVIVTGMIRPEDFNESGVSSQKLLDPQYDVVSIRRNKENENKTN